jgi:hypothetical protein
VVKFVKNKFNVTCDSCEKIECKSVHGAFKIGVDYCDFKKVINPLLWPSGVIINKFSRPRYDTSDESKSS